MNPETDIICLEIVKGVPKAPGDSESAEQDLVTLDLLDANGFSVQPDGWTMGLPGIKRGGIWAESQIADGRTLIAATKENVTETIQLAIGNKDLLQRYQLFTKLQRMIDDARAFWSDNYQIEPVYLKFKANGARVFQYALIYDMSIADNSDPYEIAEAVEVTLVLERESAWRMVVPPGGNPIEFAFWQNGKTRGVDYTWEDMGLYGNDANQWLVHDPDNACEFNGNDKTTFLTETWVDIEASKIPGDAPALLCAYWQMGAAPGLNQWYMARRTEPPYRYMREINDNGYQRNTLNAGDANTVTAVVDSCGLLSRDQIINRYIHQSVVTAATTTFTQTLGWHVKSTYSSPFDINQMHGNWAVYLRCQTTTGADGDVEARLRIVNLGSVGDDLSLPGVQVPVITAGASCAEFDLAYLGRLSLPLDNNVSGDLLGTGLRIGGLDELYFYIDTRNTAGANRTFEVLDMVFMPIDEGFCVVNADSLSGHVVLETAGNVSLAVDNTGYSIHGRTDDYSGAVCTQSANYAIQLQGAALKLKPMVDNRIYFLQRLYDGSQQICPGIGASLNTNSIYLNIVPRCYGVADL